MINALFVVVLFLLLLFAMAPLSSASPWDGDLERGKPDEPEMPDEPDEPEMPEELDEPDELLLFLLVDVPAFLAEAVEAVARPAVELVGDEFSSLLALPTLSSAVEFEVD